MPILTWLPHAFVWKLKVRSDRAPLSRRDQNRTSLCTVSQRFCCSSTTSLRAQSGQRNCALSNEDFATKRCRTGLTGERVRRLRHRIRFTRFRSLLGTSRTISATQPLISCAVAIARAFGVVSAFAAFATRVIPLGLMNLRTLCLCGRDTRLANPAKDKPGRDEERHQERNACGTPPAFSCGRDLVSEQIAEPDKKTGP